MTEHEMAIRIRDEQISKLEAQLDLAIQTREIALGELKKEDSHRLVKMAADIEAKWKHKSYLTQWESEKRQRERAEKREEELEKMLRDIKGILGVDDNDY